MKNKLKDKKIIIPIIILILIVVIIIVITQFKTNQAYKTNSQNPQQELEEVEMQETTEIYLDEGLADNQTPSDNAVYKLSDETIAELEAKAERFWERDQEILKPYIEKGLTKENYIELWKDNAYFLGEKQEDVEVQKTHIRT